MRAWRSGFVEAVLKADVMDLKYFGVVDDTHAPVYSVSIPRVPRHGGGRRRARQLLMEL